MIIGAMPARSGRLPALVPVVFILISVNIASALPTTKLGSSCDLSVIGAKETSSFLRFDQEFRAALAANDAAAMALLVRFPLRVNTGHGSFSLNDPAILQSRFDQVFPPYVRAAIAGQKPSSVFCNYTGLMYGNGAVWINKTRHGYAIWTVNLEETSPAVESRNSRESVFVCHTAKHRILIDVDAVGIPRYRAWNALHLVTDKPDLEISDGKRDYEGTGPCAHALWTFKSGIYTYSLEEAGCVPVPRDAKGRLTVSADGKQQWDWCY